MRKNRSLSKILQFSASVLVGLSGLLLIRYGSVIFDASLTLQPYSLLTKFWESIPYDIPTEFYLFNWTNPHEIYNLSVKPKFEQKGPYKFWQKERKVNITWNDNGTVTFRQQKFWVYDTSPENGNLSDMITSADPLVLGAGYELRKWNYYLRKAVFYTLSGRLKGLSRTHAVRDVLFDGYKEPLIPVAASLPIFKHLHLPHWAKFAWLYTRNGSVTQEGIFNIGTGVNSTLGELYFWNYKEHSSYFDGICAMIYGSSGQFFPQNLQKDRIAIFSPDLHRTVELYYEKEETVNGILGYKYIMDARNFDNGTINPENSCLCTGQCVPSGVLNASASSHGFPGFLSLPHFYQADPHYINLVEGMKIEPELHQFYIIIEPNTGIPIKVDIKLQLNILLEPVSGITILEKAPRIFIPIFWTRQFCELDGIYVILLQLLINVSSITITTGCVLLLICPGFIFYLIYGDYKGRQLLKKSFYNLEVQRIPLTINSNENY